MSDDVTQIVAELRKDHSNMSLLLDLIEQEANCLYDGGTPDYELLHDVMQYMTVYPDVVHHPKEDRLYAEIKEVRPDLSSGFQRITIDHQNIAAAGRKIRDSFALIESGGILDRKSVVGDALRYVNDLRSHMQWEELDLFQRCLTMAREGHRFLTDISESGIPDPLFGKSVAANFEYLYRQIKDTQALRSRSAGTG